MTIFPQLLAALTFLLGATSTEGNWEWPTHSAAPIAVARAFDPPARPWLSGHRGVDVALPEGTDITAAAPGTVIYAGDLAGRPVVSIQHSSGLRSTYEPVDPRIGAGEVVSAGDVVGTLRAGHGQGTNLHWGAKFSDEYYVDPLALILGPMTLKPW